jgi:hypothetical protein
MSSARRFRPCCAIAILLASIENHHLIEMRHWGRAQEIAGTLAAEPAQPLPGIQ